MKKSNTMGTKDRGQNRKWQNESEKQLQSARLHTEKPYRNQSPELQLHISFRRTRLPLSTASRLYPPIHQQPRLSCLHRNNRCPEKRTYHQPTFGTKETNSPLYLPWRRVGRMEKTPEWIPQRMDQRIRQEICHQRTTTIWFEGYPHPLPFKQGKDRAPKRCHRTSYRRILN